jgi:hypothetical protein
MPCGAKQVACFRANCSVGIRRSLTGVGVSVGIGLIFEVWRGLKAARLNPVEVLRYESLSR